MFELMWVVVLVALFALAFSCFGPPRWPRGAPAAPSRVPAGAEPVLAGQEQGPEIAPAAPWEDVGSIRGIEPLSDGDMGSIRGQAFSDGETPVQSGGCGASTGRAFMVTPTGIEPMSAA